MKHGRIDVLDGLYEHEYTFEEAKVAIEESCSGSKFTDGLKRASKALDKLNFNQYEGTPEQDRLIEDILCNAKNLVSVYEG
jgi:hypothetical protein